MDLGAQEDAAADGESATWWGIAGYAAYDWTEKLRTAVRLEYFDDADEPVFSGGTRESQDTVAVSLYSSLLLNGDQASQARMHSARAAGASSVTW